MIVISLFSYCHGTLPTLLMEAHRAQRLLLCYFYITWFMFRYIDYDKDIPFPPLPWLFWASKDRRRLNAFELSLFRYWRLHLCSVVTEVSSSMPFRSILISSRLYTYKYKYIALQMFLSHSWYISNNCTTVFFFVCLFVFYPSALEAASSLLYSGMSDHREDEFDLGLDFDYVPKEKREQPKDGPPPKTVYERERDAKIAQLKAEHQKQQPQVIKNNVEKGERFTSAPSPPLADGRSYPRSSHSRPYHTSQPQPPPTHMPNGMPDGGVPPPSDSVSAQHGQARDDRGGGSGRSWRRGDWNQRGSGGERSDPNRPPPDPRFLTFRQNKFKMRNALREVDVATMQPAELTIATSSNPDGTGGATSRYYQPPPPTHHNHARTRTNAAAAVGTFEVVVWVVGAERGMLLRIKAVEAVMAGGRRAAEGSDRISQAGRAGKRDHERNECGWTVIRSQRTHTHKRGTRRGKPSYVFAVYLFILPPRKNRNKKIHAPIERESIAEVVEEEEGNYPQICLLAVFPLNAHSSLSLSFSIYSTSHATISALCSWADFVRERYVSDSTRGILFSFNFTMTDARERFLISLQAFASDDDVDKDGDVHARSSSAREENGEGALAMANTIIDGAVAAKPASALFGSPLEAFTGEEEVDSSKGDATKGPARHVGISLLRRMEVKRTPASSSYCPDGSGCIGKQPREDPEMSEAVGVGAGGNKPGSNSSTFSVVKRYKPLSSGGFMCAAEGAADRQRCMAVGAVVCVPKRLAEQPAKADVKSGSSGNSSPASSPTTASHTTPTTARSPAAATNQASSFSNAVTTASPARRAIGSVGTTAAKELLTKRFKSESQMNADEFTYGRRLDPQLWSSLAEVTRCDAARGVVEALFLSGERAKLHLFDIRPAGFVEQKLYAKWKSDPSSRPVQVIGSPSGHTPVSSSPTNTVAGEGGAACTDGSSTVPCPSSDGPTPSPTPWWIARGLVVRIVADDAGEAWLGHKAVVQSVDRKEGTMRLLRLPPAPPARGMTGSRVRGGGETTFSTSRAPGSTCDDVLDVIGVDSVETVVPRRGETGLLVLGERRGELVRVLERSRGAAGEGLAKVVVTPAAGPPPAPGTGAEGDQGQPADASFSVFPYEICAMHKRG
eukprot:gene7427-5228_t